ncbi:MULTISPECIES: efflux RND transporter permease subunit [Paenibacillus]|uniref:efflux RND transporter permease subunit n=1 Tax=Paenibacillus TaxID=44249 RepID=UPI0009A8F905|nr:MULTISPECIES: efflux RND transporter permease subunit [unclassified Paenibacillus]SLK06727.1 hydrophobic/amphiphilic exporter-1, HAE1 family [Paenibacillus sp. RU5A]SOC70626.1 hydrophobic/amphiphilic exporter-1, HAE1 family [Paenibacillus sp. RU26A]SOC72742.1 hydrophobic/amphiphilic exporter-1, HAE1 family [Paenibacillus sp. RU5M]
MKGIINFSLNNKFAIWILTIIVSFAGLYSGLTMKQETIPNINVPFLSVTAIDPGAAPEGIVEDVTKPLEQTLRNVEGIKTLTSTSMENASSITLEFDYGTDLDNATAAVREALNEVQLPDGVQKPTISKFSINSFPVVSLSLSDKDGGDLEQLTRLVETDIQPALEDIDGVAQVQVSGQYVKEVQLKFDQKKMNELGLTEDTVNGIVQGSSVRVPLGLFELDKAQKAVVVDGNIIDLDDLKNLAIPVVPSGAGAGSGSATAPQGAGAQAGGAAQGSAQGSDQAAGQAAGGNASVGSTSGAANAPGIPTVKLSEIAKIEVIGQAESISRTDGKESIGISIVKSNDANTVDVVKAVKDKAEELQTQFKNAELTVLLDQGKPIQDSVNTMLFKAMFGALFAILIILLFLRDIRSTIISIVSIPLSLLIALTALNMMDITLNMMTLGAMTVAIGRVVDDSIVVIENIYRRLTLKGEKLKGRDLIREATREMFIPILSSTIVTIAVFLPLALVSGMVGELFMPFALTMVFALLASLIVAVTIVPMLAHTLFRKGLKNKQNHEEKPGKMAEGYKRLLNWTLSHKLITVGVAVLLLVGSLFLYPFIGASFLPEQQDKYVTITYSPETGALREDVEKEALVAEKWLLTQPGLEKMQYSIGGSNPLSSMGGGSSNSALFYIEYNEDTKDFTKVKEQLVEGLKKEVTVGTWNELDMSGGLGGSSLSLSIYGDNVDQIKPVSDEILKLVEADTESFEKADTTLSDTYGQYTLVADQEKLSSLGLTAGQLAMTLSPARERPVLTEVDIENKTYKVYVETDKKTFTSIADIENEKVTSPLGIEVPIKDVAKVEEGTSPNSIMRIDGKVVVQVSANILASDVQKASSNLQANIDKLDLPDGVEVKFGGTTEQINDTFTQLGLAMLAAIAIVYFVLVVTFGGGLAPFAILFSLPFTVIGIMVGLFVAGGTLDVSAMMGGLMLIGIVVTNAIVLIDRVIHKEKEGMPTREALLEAGATRLRPILMTALATIGALLPLVTGLEESAGIISKGLGITVIGGLISSTLLTLVIVPIVYEFLMKFKKKRIED